MSDIQPLFPRWAQSIRALLGSNALTRSQCKTCGIQQRVDLEALAAKLGGAETLIARADRCNIVACHGSVFYMAARTFGRQWIALELRADQLGEEEPRAAACNAQSLVLVGRTRSNRGQ
jgi:hypothetical protein